MNSKRHNGLDLLRIVSTVAVIVLHVNFQYFKNRMNAPSFTAEYLCESIINIITRFSVPCFVMLSGAFQLDVSRNIKESRADFYKKTTYKIYLPSLLVIIALLILSELQEIMTTHKYIEPIKKVISGDFYNLWYLYMLTGLYLATPLIRILRRNITEEYYKRITLVFFVGGYFTSVLTV